MLGIFLDTETNGLDPFYNRVIDIAYQIVDLTNGHIIDAFESVISISFEEWQKSNPASLAINGFSWEDLKQGRSEDIVAQHIQNAFKSYKVSRENAVFICQNPSFDRAFFNQLISADIQEQLNWPYHWLDLASMHFSKCLLTHSSLPWEIGLSKNAIAAHYHIPPEATPHKAMNGVKHLVACYQAVIGFENK